MKKRLETIQIGYYGVLLLIVAIISVTQLKIQSFYKSNEKIMSAVVDYNLFRTMNLSIKLIQKAAEDKEKDYIGYITYEMLENEYNLQQKDAKIKTSVFRQMEKVEDSMAYTELYYYYDMIFKDLKYFPIPLQQKGEAFVCYDDSWGAVRTYGGNRLHEGTDIMASNNKRGFFPIISVSDGVVEKKGWLPQGGYRIGVRAPQGAYFYYAHLFSYADGIEEGTEVKAGQLLGFMGDSGYGEEGTIGKFAVHLHFGIYIDSKLGEMSVNPYWILKYLENKRLTCEY